VKFGGNYFEMKNYNENEIKAPGFFVKLEWEDLINDLSNEEAGVMFKNMFNFLQEKELIETSKLGCMLFKHTVVGVLIFNKEKYINQCIHNREVGKKGGRPKKDQVEKKEETRNNPSGYFENPEKPKDKARAIDKVIVKEIDTDIEIDNDTEKEIATGRIKETDPRFRIFYLRKFKNLLDVIPDSLTNQDDRTYVQRANHLHRKLGAEKFSKLIFEPQSEEAQEIINAPEFKLNLSDLDFVRYHMVGYLRRLVK